MALNKGFCETLPSFPEVPKEEADIAWLIYDMKPPVGDGLHFEIFRERTVYTRFEPALAQITKSQPGRVEDFLSKLQEKIDEKLDTPPINRTLDNPTEGMK